jgi:hypothetical protein
MSAINDTRQCETLKNMTTPIQQFKLEIRPIAKNGKFEVIEGKAGTVYIGPDYAHCEVYVRRRTRDFRAQQSATAQGSVQRSVQR